MGYIYKILCSDSQKIYIGCTIKDVHLRFSEHLSRHKSAKYKSKLYNAFKKYGVECFSIEVIEECDNDVIYEREKYYIEKFDSFNSGYNSTIGGEGSTGYKHTEEGRKKCKTAAEKVGAFRKGKSYLEIYGDSACAESEKRSEGVKSSYNKMTQEQKDSKAFASAEANRIKLGYSIEFIIEIRKKYESGMKPRHLKEEYPNLEASAIKNLISKSRYNHYYKCR